MKMNEKGQMVAPATIKMTENDFKNNNGTSVYWLGGGGAVINSHGTILMIDPVLEGFDMPLLIDIPVSVREVPKVDAVLLTHSDSDHYSRATCKALKPICKEYHTTPYVASLLKEECDIEGVGHNMDGHVQVADIDIELTPADHAWQRLFEEYNYRVWEDGECCGFYLRTRDAKIWCVGDSKLMECQLHMDPPDVILFDFSDNFAHIGLENSYKLANAYPNAKLVLIHWGTIDAPNDDPFNGNPQNIFDNVVNPERVVLLAPGQEYKIK